MSSTVRISDMVRHYVIIVIVVGVVLGTAFFFFSKSRSNNQLPDTINDLINTGQDQIKNGGFRFVNPKKSAHYESNTPGHGSILAGVPINIVIDFNFDLAKPSEIKILKEGKDVGVGETIIDTNKLTLRRLVEANSSDGLYRVEYKACWPDASCHDGFFEFAIDRSQAKDFVDKTDSKEVVIDMNHIAFDPKNVKISKGTKVIWKNNDEVGHYINTDSHPAHTYFPDQNSKLLNKREEFEVVFDKPGVYPYHCSAHAATMTGAILVE